MPNLASKESQSAEMRNRKMQENQHKRRLSCKIDYFPGSNRPNQSIDCEFFTPDPVDRVEALRAPFMALKKRRGIQNRRGENWGSRSDTPR
jgi:hypothetical protein